MARFSRVGLVVGSMLIACSFGCEAPAPAEEQRLTTAKLLKAHEAFLMPASDTQAFTEAMGGVPVDINGYRGYVAGTIEGTLDQDALFALHLSGTKDGAAVAGLTIAFVETPGAAGDLASRLENCGTLQVRFNNRSN